MEYLIIVALIVLVFFLFVRKKHKHYVLIARSEGKDTFHVVKKEDHGAYLNKGILSQDFYMSREFIISTMKEDGACFYTYSVTKKNYVKVRVSSRGFLTTEFDDVKDNNIESLEILV